MAGRGRAGIEIAATISFLCAAAVTGTTVSVDSGLSI